MGEVNAWDDAAGPLETLARALAITGHQYETAEKWTYLGELDGAPLVSLFPHLLGLRSRYGDALKLTVKRGPDTRIDLGKKTPTAEELKALESASGLKLDITVIKRTLAESWGLAAPGVVTRLYFFHQALARDLSVPLMELDTGPKAFFKDVPAGEKLIVLVPGHDIELAGTLLAIAGGVAMSRWKDAVPAQAPGEPSMLALAKAQIKGELYLFHRLTPLHLAVEVKEAAEGDPVAAALYGQLLACSVVYLAAYSKWRADAAAWTCTFASERQETAVEIRTPPSLPKSEWSSALCLAELARWTWEKPDEADDRLIIVQRTAVDELQSNTAVANGTEILRRAEDLSQRAKWGWEAFLGGELRKYLAQEKELEETVERTAREYNDQVHTLTKTLIDNMLAAVAVVIGSLIAATVRTPFDKYVFRIGTGVYAVYLLVFPMLFGLFATWQRFRKSKTTFEARRKSFTARLLDKPVTKIVEPVIDDTEQWFRRWFRRAAIAYSVVLLLFVIAFFAVPPVLAGRSRGLVLSKVEVNRPRTGGVIVRGTNFDARKDITVTLGSSTFSNVTNPPTLQVHGTTMLTFTAPEKDLASSRGVTVWQGEAAPETIALRP